MFLQKKILIANKQVLKVLNSHAPFKRYLLRADHSPYISKTLRKGVMKRFYLEKIFFKKRTHHSLRAYKKQKKKLLLSPL